MPDIQQDIRDWLHQQQDWLQDAAEKLLLSGNLTEADIQAIAEHLKTPDGQRVTTHRIFGSHTSIPASKAKLRLKEIGDIKGIENLCPRNPLTFGNGNLAVIYGRNGSGKSGYTRILKRACGKPRAADLKPNVFEDSPITRQCRITYSLGETDQSVEWQANDAPINDIRGVDIFDSDAATFYLNRETEASYTPPSVAMFEELAVICSRVKTRLQEEQNRLVSVLPTLPQEYFATAAGNDYTALKLSLGKDDLKGLTNWGESEQKALDTLTKRLKVADPAILAQKKRSTKGQLDQLLTHLRKAAGAVGTERVEAISKARTEALAKRQIATQAAQVGTARLDGIGTDTWNALWQVARAFSQKAYPGRDFPFTEDGAVCVLCHQELAQDAQQRLRDFEEFVQGAIEAEAKTAEDAYEAALNSLPAILSNEDIRTRCEAAGLTGDSWTEKLGGFWAQVAKCCEFLRRGEMERESVAVELPHNLLSEIMLRAEALENEALQNDEDATSFDRGKAQNDKLNLEARCWIAQQAVAITREVALQKSVKMIEHWKKLANSRNVSLKAGDIAEQVITQAYVDRFNRELQMLGASRIKVELIKTRTEKGRALHRLRLRGMKNGEFQPESVLSEGERRIVALAAFLADVAEKPHATPFIFDDPISSLDQDFEQHVATRLATLAQNRQVLIFTHRLSLYGAMEVAAKKIGEKWKKRHLQQIIIESFSGVAGHPVNASVWNTNTTKATNILLTRLDKAKGAGKLEGADAYRLHARGICTDFRVLLERTVEDDLLNQIVRRHRRSITTDNRLAPLSQITTDDCSFFDGLMTKYSCFEHSQSQEAPSFLPEEPELRKDLEKLKVWRADFKRRAADLGA